VSLVPATSPSLGQGIRSRMGIQIGESKSDGFVFSLGSNEQLNHIPN
jgi:NOL1/NOP2/fmu family ribosome biogenesis protein